MSVRLRILLSTAGALTSLKRSGRMPISKESLPCALPAKGSSTRVLPARSVEICRGAWLRSQSVQGGLNYPKRSKAHSVPRVTLRQRLIDSIRSVLDSVIVGAPVYTRARFSLERYTNPWICLALCYPRVR